MLLFLLLFTWVLFDDLKSSYQEGIIPPVCLFYFWKICEFAAIYCNVHGGWPCHFYVGGTLIKVVTICCCIPVCVFSWCVILTVSLFANWSLSWFEIILTHEGWEAMSYRNDDKTLHLKLGLAELSSNVPINYYVMLYMLYYMLSYSLYF